MSKEILLVVDAVSNEKGVDKSIIFEAIEAALASATKKRNLADIEVRVEIDRKTGDHKAFRRWQVIEDGAEMALPDQQVRHMDAVEQQAEIQVDDYIEEPIEAVAFGRIAAQAAKQVIVQKVREAERAQVVDAYRDRVNDVLSGVIKRIERGNVYLDLGGNIEAMVPREHTIPRESLRVGDRIRGLLYEVRHEQRGPQLFMSRTSPQLLVELFTIEVPEIGNGMIELLSAARDPGQRAKIAVKTKDQRIDPVGACVGMRGSRVQAVSNELAGERVDIILWDDNPAQFVINAMAPAEVVSIVVDEDRGAMDIAVIEEKLSQAIGRGGQNIRLASQLTGWELNVMTEQEAEDRTEQETQKVQRQFMEQLGVDEEVALILVQEGFVSVEEIAYVPAAELANVEEFDSAMVDELRNRARDVLLTQAIAKEELGEAAEQDLVDMDGMSEQLLEALVAIGIRSREDLAEQAIDDLLVIDGMDADWAGELIMEARKIWFEEDDAMTADGDNAADREAASGAA